MKIQKKLFLILFSFSVVLITTLILFMQWSIGKGMIDYVNTKELEKLEPLKVALVNEYNKNGSWSEIINRRGKFMSLVLPNRERRNVERRPPPRRNDKGLPPPRKGKRPPEHDAGYALFDINMKWLTGLREAPDEFNRSAIVVNDKTVGYLAILKRDEHLDGYELDFIEQQTIYLWIVALVAVVLVLILTFALSRHIVVPIKLIARNIHRLTQGDYQQTVKLTRKDELGDLNRDCNELALALSESDKGRKHWLAATSHELRTPVAILSGELEAMYHGIRPLNRENIQSSIDEVKHLSRLINDLHQLNGADIGGMHYRKKRENIASLLNSEQDKYQTFLGREQILLNVNLHDLNVPVHLDKTRFFQLIDNILDNVIKYSHATLVDMELSTEDYNGGRDAVIRISDNGDGVPEEHLPKLFEYLYRVEDSRNRSTGGSGLGLSICRSIVDAHKGKVVAEKSPSGGLSIIIRMPTL